jgi:hypothetical protein
MPDGSSSAAPVINPGPRSAKKSSTGPCDWRCCGGWLAGAGISGSTTSASRRTTRTSFAISRSYVNTFRLFVLLSTTVLDQRHRSTYHTEALANHIAAARGPSERPGGLLWFAAKTAGSAVGWGIQHGIGPSGNRAMLIRAPIPGQLGTLNCELAPAF